MVLKPVIAAIALCIASALPAEADERGDIFVACEQLGLLGCDCIADDSMAVLDAEMRELVLLSLRDEVGFTIRAQSGEFGTGPIAALTAYQQTVQAKCTPPQ